MIDAIRPERVVDVWPEAAPQLQRALDRTKERTLHDVLVQLVTGNAQLWRAYGGWCVTEIQPFPRKRVALVSLFGGTFDKAHVREMRDVLQQWARHYHCDEIRIVGRRGWLKFLPEFDHHTVLTCPLPTIPPTSPSPTP